MIWFKYYSYDYMDEIPEIGYHLFEDDTQAKDWVEHMNSRWSGGYVWIDGYATKEEMLKFIEDNNIELDEATSKNVYDDNHYKSF